ncbi:hypothetical protein [Paraconexibacter algicola]|uniref:Uncharacterized protein n=1 Tax=Paraconexibacter algicola TaxID=2133960 RepID=A0A2T4UDB6_9ACTN|nr:hypothetical protein [Paraconexibacter algicola]PTL55494.1 hypothetical protein C7Y72_17740 [Paraconexibacter algicola]
MTARTARTIALAALASTAVAAPVASAAAAEPQERALGVPVADVGKIVAQLGSTIGGIVGGTIPGVGAIITETTNSVGGLISGTTLAVSESVDATIGQVLNDSGLGGIIGPDTPGGGAKGGLLPTDALNNLLKTLGIPTVAGTGAGQAVAPDGTVVADAQAPTARFTVLSKLRDVQKDGKLRLQVTTDEPGVVAFSSTLRPGVARAAAARSGTRAVAHSRRVIHIPTVTLGFRQAGTLKVTVQLAKTAQRTLGNAKDARISVGIVAADSARNQVSGRVKQTVGR